MNASDIIIGLVVLVAFVLCVRAVIRNNKEGECADCAMGSSCDVHDSGHCMEAEKLMAAADAAANKYAATHPQAK